MVATDMSDFSASSAYIARTFLGEQHLKKVNATMSVRWGKLNSLSAALQLMKAHGVELTPEEEEELATKDEADQIASLVGKMPPQTTDEFQHFFLQLQLLVQTATGLRLALEEGRSDLVEKALEDAEATGISQYMLRVAVVQASSQAKALKDGMVKFVQEGDAKMGRLIRGQQDCTAAQKKLAMAQSQLVKKGNGLVSTLAPFMMGFVGRANRTLLHMTFHGWRMTHEREMMERKVEEEFKMRVQDLEDGLTDWKKRQLECSNGTMMKQIMNANATVAHDMFGLWREAAVSLRSEREHAETHAQFEAKLANAKAEHVELAKQIVSRMRGATDETVLQMCLQTWAAELHEGKVKEAATKATQKFARQTTELGEAKLQSTKFFLKAFFNASSSSVATMVFKAWREMAEDVRTQSELADNLQKKASLVTSWGEKRREVGKSAMGRAATHIEEMLVLRSFAGWRLHKHMERAMRFHQTLIEGKRQQLQGVQHMFRDFACQLEQGIGKDSARDFWQPTKPQRQRPQALAPLKEKELKPLGRAGNSVSLPDIHNVSRPGSRGSLTGAKLP